MKYISGYNRNQQVLFPTSLDEAIDKNNEVRIIDLFVESLDIASMGFKIDHTENLSSARPSETIHLRLS